MAGEKEVTRTQPGGRSPAPGALAVVQAFINTHFDLDYEHGAEVLSDPAALAAWLQRAGLTTERIRADAADLERALTIREGLRAFAAGGPDRAAAMRELDRAGHGAAVELRFGRAGPSFVPAPDSGTAGALGVLLALTARAVADGSWSRLKICPGEHCGWAFYDHSRNRSGRWCAMSVCGGRAKARRHYRRRQAAEL